MAGAFLCISEKNPLLFLKENLIYFHIDMMYYFLKYSIIFFVNYVLSDCCKVILLPQTHLSSCHKHTVLLYSRMRVNDHGCGTEELIDREGNMPNAIIINSVRRAQNSTLHSHGFCGAFVLVKGCSCLFHVDSTTRKAIKYHDNLCEH